MRKSTLWLLVLLALILQVTVFTKIEIWAVRPDASIIVLVYLALGLGALAGTLFGFLLGLAQLSILSISMASAPLAATLVGFLVGKYGTKVMYESYLVQLLIIFLAVMIFDAVNFAWSSPGQLLGTLVRYSVPGAAYTAVVGVLLALVVQRIMGLRLVA
jgi:rod shape-determining protein MreD